jgi:hypothetical protein
MQSSLCEFVGPDTKGWCHCRWCKNKLRSDAPSACFATCNAPPCIHRGEATGAVATIVCVGCRGDRQVRQYPIFACAVFGECLPDFACTRASKDAMAEWMEKDGRRGVLAVCRGCERRELTAQAGASA